MFYKQSVDNIKLVILSLDGGLLDLNRLRYNYFNRICKNHNQSISKEDFYNNLGNYHTMYDISPIQDVMKNEELEFVIERDLFAYSKLKQNIKREGVDELLEFFKQKKIKIAVISTHKTKRAMQYMQLAGIYQYVDFIIGGDCKLQPLPNNEILESISNTFNIAPADTLVIANYYNLVLAANKSLMNIIYLSDLANPNKKVKESVFQSARNNLEVINIFLFSKYNTAEIYSPLLGMNDKMDSIELTDAYNNLKERFSDDEQLLAIVTNTYEHYLKKLNFNISDFEDEEVVQEDNTEIKEPEDLSEQPNSDEEESSDDETLQPNDSPEEEIPVAPIVEESNKDEISPEEKVEPEAASTFVMPAVDQEPTKENVIDMFNDKDVDSTVTSAINVDAQRMNELMDVINGQASKELDKEELEEPIPEDNEEIKKESKYTKLINFVYLFVINFLVALLGMIAYIPLEKHLTGEGLFAVIVGGFVDFYVSLVRNLYTIIFSIIHTVISAFPNYSGLMKSNGFLSPTAIELLLFTIFNVLICYIFKGIFYLISDEVEDEDEDEEKE